MPARFFRGAPFLNPQENEAFRNLCTAGARLLDAGEDARILGNIVYSGRIQIDAVVLKRRAITIVDFKHYGGEVRVTEGTAWVTSGGVEVMGGSRDKNPFQQIRRYKNKLMKALSSPGLLPPGSDLTHISGVVIFTKQARVDVSAMSGRNRKWFHAADFIGSLDFLRDATSPCLDLPPACLDTLVQRFPVAPFDLKASEMMVPASEVARAKGEAERRIYQAVENEEMQKLEVEDRERLHSEYEEASRGWMIQDGLSAARREGENRERLQKEYEEASRSWMIQGGLEATRRAVTRHHPNSDLADRIVSVLREALRGHSSLRDVLEACRHSTDLNLERILGDHGVEADNFPGPHARRSDAG